MIDVFFLRPGNKNAVQMKARWSKASGLSLHSIIEPEAINELRPPQDSIFIFHLSGSEDVQGVVEQIQLLNKEGGPTIRHFVVSDLKAPEVEKLLKTLPGTTYSGVKTTVIEADRTLTKLVKEQVSRQTDTLVYEQDKISLRPSQATSNKFRPVTEPDLQRKLLHDALESQAKVVLSNFGSHEDIKGQLLDLDDEKTIFFVRLDGEKEKQEAFRKRADEGGKIAISIALKQSRVFFVASDFRWAGDGRIELKIPSLVYFVQRRKDFRLLVYPSELFRIRMQVGKDYLSLPVYDIGASGIAVLCTKEQFARLEKTGDLAQIQILFETNNMKFGPLRLRQSQPFMGEGGEAFIKAGFSFEQIPPGFKKTLSNFIDQKARDYVLNYVIENPKIT